MENRFLKFIGYWAMALILFVATFIVIRWAVAFATWSTLDSGWAQAIGSVAAIMASFFLFSRQRKLEQQAAKDDALHKRLIAMQTVGDVADQVIYVVREEAEAFECHFESGVTSDLKARLRELRGILDRFADPTADRIVVLVSLIFSKACAETESDVRVVDYDLDSYVVARLAERIAELEKIRDELHRQIHALMDKCRARGIDIDHE